MVLTPSEEERKMLAKNVNNFVAFTSFIKAYTDPAKADEIFKKTLGSILVRIELPFLGKHNSIVELDFGYFIN